MELNSQILTKKRDLILPEDAWECELDNLGPFAPNSELEAHLAKAPQENETVKFLSEYLQNAMAPLRPTPLHSGR